MNISDKGVTAICLFEGTHKKGDLHYAYADQGGVWTCGYGSTAGVNEHTCWTDDQARAALLRDLLAAENAVRRQVPVNKLSQNQYDALVSWVFNLGPRPQATLWKKLNAGDIQGAADEFPKWNLVAGKPNAGVARRREAERRIFLNAAYPITW